MDRGAWRAAVHGVTKSQTQLKRLNTSTVSTLPSQFPIPWLYHESCDVTEQTGGVSLSLFLFFFNILFIEVKFM